ncbi:hypothetical protein M758_11G119600 [Ceratodon purpureus]|nr:hypothetical protein M758_11G119600 [Ceratodon purpureus]
MIHGLVHIILGYLLMRLLFRRCKPCRSIQICLLGRLKLVKLDIMIL